MPRPDPILKPDPINSPTRPSNPTNPPPPPTTSHVPPQPEPTNPLKPKTVTPLPPETQIKITNPAQSQSPVTFKTSQENSSPNSISDTGSTTQPQTKSTTKPNTNSKPTTNKNPSAQNWLKNAFSFPPQPCTLNKTSSDIPSNKTTTANPLGTDSDRRKWGETDGYVSQDSSHKLSKAEIAELREAFNQEMESDGEFYGMTNFEDVLRNSDMIISSKEDRRDWAMEPYEPEPRPLAIDEGLEEDILDDEELQIALGHMFQGVPDAADMFAAMRRIEEAIPKARIEAESSTAQQQRQGKQARKPVLPLAVTTRSKKK